MKLDELRSYCLSKKGTSEDFPFDAWTLVFRVGSKIFAMTDIKAVPLRVNLKCDPQRAVELRERYSEVQPGYYMNKKHWNTIDLEKDLSVELIKELIDHSYELVFKSLKRDEKEKIAED